VHKSQGSEFDEVLLVLPPEPHPLATRELLYTAVTRARRQVIVHAGEAALRHACATRVQRTSALAERLGWAVMNGADEA
jgi:exodeoxyribonuclease V alpha subunit